MKHIRALRRVKGLSKDASKRLEKAILAFSEEEIAQLREIVRTRIHQGVPSCPTYQEGVPEDVQKEEN